MKKIVFFGDSITDMRRMREPEAFLPYVYGNGYVFLLEAKLSTLYPAEYQVINRGISGNRVVDLYARIKADVWNEQPDYLSVLVGINDIWHELNYRNGVSLDRYENIYDLMLKETTERLPDTKILLMEPFVLDGTDTHENLAAFGEIYAYAKAVKRLAEKYHCAFVPLQKMLTEKGKRYGDGYVLRDGVHPMVAGSEWIAEEWLKAFETIR